MFYSFKPTFEVISFQNQIIKKALSSETGIEMQSQEISLLFHSYLKEEDEEWWMKCILKGNEFLPYVILALYVIQSVYLF